MLADYKGISDENATQRTEAGRVIAVSIGSFVQQQQLESLSDDVISSDGLETSRDLGKRIAKSEVPLVTRAPWGDES